MMNVNQERMQTLLVETVTMLCRNGLTFQTDIRVQGLLGITVDGQEVILVSMDEKIDHDYGDSTSLRGLGAEKQTKKLQNTVSVPVPRTVASRQNRNVSGDRRSQYLALKPSPSYGIEQAVTSPSRFGLGGDAYDSEYSDQVPANKIKQSKVTSSSSEFSGTGVQPAGSSRSVGVSDEAIFIESDDDENGVKQEEFVHNDQQQTDYHVDSELQAGCSSEYFVQPNSREMFSVKFDPVDEQQQYMDYSVNTQSEDYTHDAGIKLELSEQPVRSWNSASGVSGNVKKFRKPMQHFGNRGVPSWRRKPAHKSSVLNSDFTNNPSSTDQRRANTSEGPRGYADKWSKHSAVSTRVHCLLCGASYALKRGLLKHQTNVHGRQKLARGRPRKVSD